MKRAILFLLSGSFFLVLPGLSTAQVTVSLGSYTGAGSTNVLLSTSTTINRYSRTISLYTASEIITAGGMTGTITSLAWDKQGTGEYISGDAYIKVYFKHVTNSQWGTSPVPDWDTEVTGATEVFTSSTYSIPTGTGWKQVSFSTPFVWNGVDNIAVFVEWDRSSAPTASITWGRSTTTSANATRVGSTSLSALVMLVNSSRPLLQLTITGSTSGVTDVVVSTQNSVPPVISTLGGSLQMEAEVLPLTESQVVHWSVVPGTGSAVISTSGLLTAQSDGTVWAKAVSDQDGTKMDSLEITITNQHLTVDSVRVSTENNVAPTISIPAGTLQMEAEVYPASLSQSVVWSIIPGTGDALISTSGLVTAQADGNVWAKAVSNEDGVSADSLEITITNQGIGIDDVAQRIGFRAYPNPAGSGILHVAIDEDYLYQKSAIEIMDVSGRPLGVYDMQSAHISIDVSKLPPGMYLLIYGDGVHRVETRFIIE